MKLNEKIYEHRKKLGLSQEELASQLGVTRQAVSKWELDDSQPDLDMIVKLAKIFHVSTDSLLCDKAEESKGDWIDRLPGMIGKLFRQFGWLSGVYLAILGLWLTFMSWFINISTQPTKNALGGFEDFAGADIVIDNTTGLLGDPFSPLNAISTALLVLGGILIVGGIVLAILLKRRNKQS